MAEEINFSNYDNPEEAERIWNAYLPDIRDGLLDKAKEIAQRSRTTVRLDNFLCEFTSPRKSNFRRGPIDYF